MSTEDVGLNTSSSTKDTRAGSYFAVRLFRRSSNALFRTQFSVLAGFVDMVAALIGTFAAGLAYNLAGYHVLGVATAYAIYCGVATFLFVTFNTLRNEYEISSFLTFAGHARRSLLTWNVSFLTALVLTFLTKQIDQLSRGTMILSYGLALLLIICGRAFMASRVKAAAVTGKVSAVRVVLVGLEDEIRAFTARYTPWNYGVDIVASFALRGPDTLDEDLALSAAAARVLKPDDIHILLPWNETKMIDACVSVFSKVPASIHLGPQPVLDRFSGLYVSRVGKVYSLQIVPRPLTIFDVVIKRAFDLMISIPMIILLAPLFLVLAIAIKLDSAGPIFFLQRRYGFNQEMFSIVKFRSMTVTEDGRVVRQATRNDPRVTRVGGFMRRYNLDELPQLLNVLRGEMSLVGPRPHALVHNQHYERIIADYARRHNVKPGITGWAQIHGLRGEVRSDAMMRQRLEHDLYYIDNWTLGLDLRILAMTLVSPKAFTNAY